MERADRSREDLRLWDVLQQLVEDRGPVGAAKALGVNYRTVVANLKAGRLSRHMRTAVQRFEGSEAGPEPAGSPELDGSRRSDDQAEIVAQQMETLAGEVRRLEQVVEAQELGRRVAALEDIAKEQLAGHVGPAVDESVPDEWRPPEREQGMPDAGVVTLEVQSDEEHAFGPAVALVAEWRELSTSGPDRRGVDRARAKERWRELWLVLMDQYHLTLPPNREQLQGSRKEDYLNRVTERLAQARRQRIRAERWQTLRRVLTLGLWRG
jgi:hypothetical protein